MLKVISHALKLCVCCRRAYAVREGICHYCLRSRGLIDAVIVGLMREQ